MSLRENIVAANKRAGLERQRAFGKKAVVRQTAEQVIESLCTRGQDVLDAFYKDQGPVALREAIQGLHLAIRIAGKRAR